MFIHLDRSCDSRKYTYFFPSYLLIPPKPTSAFQRAASIPGGSISDTPRHPFWDVPSAESSSPEQDLVRKRQWRADATLIDTLRITAKKFQGTHNFHNFTVGRDFPDRSNQRNMIKIQVRRFPSFTRLLNQFSKDCGPRCLWRYGMGQCTLPWAKFHAPPGTFSSQFSWFLYS